MKMSIKKMFEQTENELFEYNKKLLIGAKQCDITEAYKIGAITKDQYEELSKISLKPHKVKPWVSYMPRPWRDDFQY